jgi:hypothetical protein
MSYRILQKNNVALSYCQPGFQILFQKLSYLLVVAKRAKVDQFRELTKVDGGGLKFAKIGPDGSKTGESVLLLLLPLADIICCDL